MKKNLAILSLLAISSCAYALDRPDGCLGTNSVGVYGMYINASRSGGSDNDYAGSGLEINQNIFNNGSIGMDVSFDFGVISNQNRTDVYSMDDYAYALSTTVYRDGVISPYFKVTADYEFVKFDYKDSSYDDFDDDTIIICGEIGAECHLLPGWSVTPFVYSGVDTDAEDDQWTTAIGTSTCYWVNSRIGIKLVGEYTNKNDTDQFYTSLGVKLHY